MDDLTIDALTGGWTIAQRRAGHRHSTDDLLTGWYACEQVPDARRVLDLGSGIGSVGLLVLWRAKRATLTAIEAQEVSFELLETNIVRNGLDDRVRALHADLRVLRLPDERFDLVTASPPYFPPTAGILPEDSQKAHARFELRGDISDYAAAARAALADDGRFVFCFPTTQRVRAEAACANALLAIVRSRDVIPRAGVAPLFTLFACARIEGAEPEVREPPHVVRDEHGEPTIAHLAARATFGLVTDAGA